MSVTLSNSLVGLSLLSGANGFAAFSPATQIESAAVRLAKAGFTLPPTTPPWKQPQGGGGESAQLATIKRLASLVDKPARGADAPPADVETSFIAYKALDRLRLLAESAAKGSTSSVERSKLDALFTKGLGDLQAFLGTAASDRLDLAFGLPTRRAESVAMPVASALEVKGEGVLAARDAPIPGMTGAERFTLTLRKYGATDTVHVDLAGTPQPPTLDSVADAINAAIAAIPLRNADGSLHVDANGQTQPKWLIRFVPDKSTDKWGFALRNPAQEEVAISQDNAADALMVASGQTALDAPERVRLLRLDDPAAAGGTQRSLGEIAAYDRLATERAQLVQPTTKPPAGVTLSQPYVSAATSARAMVTASDGSSYIVGTSAGELDANRPSGAQDLTLTKLDSEGRVLWQRMLGAAGEARGAAISLAPNGDIVVAGTVTGAFDGQASDGDKLVARYDAAGEEKFATLVRSLGADEATAVATGADGAIYVGGRAGDLSGNAVIARLDETGRLTARRTIDSGGSESVRALAVGADGALLALTQENGAAVLRKIAGADFAADLGQIALGTRDARALAIAADGSIAVGGAIDDGAGGRDGFVARVNAALSNAQFDAIASAGTDEVDSLAFLGGRLYAGGRTSGQIGGTKTGAVDGFVVAFDPASGAQLSATQFGQVAQRTEAVRLSAAPGGASVLGAMGLARGVLTPLDSPGLVAQTSLRAGDSFSVRLGEGIARKISIAADETLATLAEKVRKALGSKANVTTPTVDGERRLRIEAKPGADVALIAGPAGSDALARLGLAPARLSVPYLPVGKEPKVQPGGTYGLGLTPALSLGTARDAAVALQKVKEAISTTQTAYRSLYWDSGKAALVQGQAGGGTVSAYQAAQVARYQDALTRLQGFTGLL